MQVIGYRPHPKLIARLPAGTYENAPAETIKRCVAPMLHDVMATMPELYADILTPCDVCSLSAVAASANLSIKFYYDESGRDGTWSVIQLVRPSHAAIVAAAYAIYYPHRQREDCPLVYERR